MVVALALVAIGEDEDGAVGSRGGDAAQFGLTGEEPARGVKKQPVGAGALTKDVRLAVAIEPVDVPVAAGEHAELGIPRRPLASRAAGGLHLKLGVGGKDSDLVRMNDGGQKDQQGHQRHQAHDGSPAPTHNRTYTGPIRNGPDVKQRAADFKSSVNCGNRGENNRHRACKTAVAHQGRQTRRGRFNRCSEQIR
jgi:hypothetical protein